MQFTDTYRTRSGRNLFDFQFVDRGTEGWRVYIDRSPSYGDRDTDGHSTHRYTDGSSRHYICFTGTLDDAREAKQVARAWAESTERYIEDGTSF